MAWRLEYTPRAIREIKAFPLSIRKRVQDKIESLQTDPRPSGCKRLTAPGIELYRVRAGDYRILYTIEQRKILIVVVRVGHRKEVYKRLGLL